MVTEITNAKQAEKVKNDQNDQWYNQYKTD